MARDLLPAGGPDHVTLRRGLVDARFLTRNKAGSAYAATMGRVGEVLAGAAQDVAPAGILEEIRRDRESRKRDRSGRKRHHEHRGASDVAR